MVLEQIYNVKWLKAHTPAAFLLGIAYSIFGIGGALLIYPSDPALLAVAITTLFFLPSLYRLTELEESLEMRLKQLDLIEILKRNKEVIKIYGFAFIGIMLAFSFFSIALPALASNLFFKAQLSVLQGQATSAGHAFFTVGLFKEIFLNNLKVLVFCFLISIFAGNGSMLLIAWNASVWGTVFGNLAKVSAGVGAANPWAFFILIMFSVLPHTILEMLSYVIATISGAAISEGFLKEKLKSDRFMNVFMINLILLIVALFVLAVAGVVETYVLDNFETYRTIIGIAFR